MEVWWSWRCEVNWDRVGAHTDPLLPTMPLSGW